MGEHLRRDAPAPAGRTSPLWGGLLRALPAGLILLADRRGVLPTGSWWWRSLVLGALNVGGFFVLIYIAGQRLPSSLAATADVDLRARA